MSSKIDMVGKRFGRLVVIEECGRDNFGQVMWKSLCDCGNEAIVRGHSLRRGDVQSCGCLQFETMQKRWESMKKKNDFKIEGDTVYVKLSNSNAEMICDIEDWEQLKDYYWYLETTGYARSVAGHAHQLIQKSEYPLVTDHINRNKLDNRKTNLRSVTRRENALNSDRHDRKIALMEGKIF